MTFDPPLIDRLRWVGREPGVEEPGPTRQVVARTYFYLYGAGATLALATLALPHAPDWEPLGVIGPLVAAYAVSLAMLLGFDRFPMWVYNSLPTLGTALSSVVVLSGGATAVAAYAGFYFWVVLSAFYLFARSWAWINMVLVATAYAVVLLLSPEADQRAVTWLMGVGALSVGGAMIGLLRDRVERLVDALAAAQRTAGIGSWELDVEAGSVRLSRQFLIMLGEDADAVVRDSAWMARRIHPEDRDRVQRAYAAALAGEGPVEIEYRLVHSDGSIRHILARGQLGERPDRRTMMVGTALDITGRKRQEQRLRRTLDQLRATTEIAVALGREIPLDALLRLIASRSCALVAGHSAAVLVADGAELVLAASSGDSGPAAGDRAVAPGGLLGGGVRRTSAAETVTLLPGLELPETQAIVAPLIFRGGAEGVLLVFARPGDERKFAEDDEQIMRPFASSAATAIASSRSVAQERLRRTIEGAEQERQRVARELHDQTLQALGALRMRLELGLLDDSPDSLEASIGKALEEIGAETENLRRIIADLRPSLLTEFGLDAAVEALAQRTASAHGIAVEVEVDGDLAQIPSDIDVTAFRIVQEALSNACKHARAGRVRIRLSAAGGELRLAVEDDGEGFEPGAAHDGFGLSGMHERVTLAGGSLALESSARGTTVQATLPASAPGPARERARGVAPGSRTV